MSLYQIQAMMVVRKKEEDEENFSFLYFKISKPYLNADKRCHLVESRDYTNAHNSRGSVEIIEFYLVCYPSSYL